VLKKNNMKLITEKELLTIFLELYSMDNSPKNWSIEKFLDKPNRLYRLHMINSLMKAFNVECTYKEFIDGEFITDTQLNKWNDFKKNIEKTPLNKEEFNGSKLETKLTDIKLIYSCLINYRLNAQVLLTSNDLIYASSGEFGRFVNLMNNISKNLYKELQKIDAVLCFCINPLGISFSEQELINNYEFPKINILDIDMECM